MNVPLLELKSQYAALKYEIDEAIERVLVEGNYVMGKEVEAFEEEWAAYCKAKYCVAVSSCTDALYLTFKAIDQPGKQVLTTPATFFATTQALILADYMPVFTDVDEEGNWNMYETVSMGNPLYLPVHLYGRPVEIPPYLQWGTVEDCAQGHGLPLRGMAACHSFYPTKNLGAFGQAGAVVTNDVDLAQRIKELRTYGEKERFVYYDVTGNHRIDEIQAAILRVKLRHLDTWNYRRREIANLYYRFMYDLPTDGDRWIRLPQDHPEHNYHIYTLRVSNRGSLAQYLKDNGIQTSIRYPVPLHLEPALEYLGYKRGSFPNAEKWADENLSLPIYPEMGDEAVEYVASKVREWIERKKS